MKSIFDIDTQTKIKERLHNLSSTSTRKWGTMTVSQMLKHVDIAFSVPTKKIIVEKDKMQFLVGNKFAQWIAIDIMPWGKNMITAKSFIVKEDTDFDKTKAAFLVTLNEFLEAKDLSGSHPIFGTLSKENWGKAMYKHLNHHLEQFGV